ncbi:alpha-ketoglutarate-dependent dioxygenase alkB homolog 7, mitochondrial [Protopterus annectens]|uniref:alpha-ketoglutarate-dependent dioxygenase alkB homolog 7, mitochondrial n=1 Tax=Protopterus annectens TaxID=7888 RepID=UPI001CFC3AC5|nr:alpha-ketoglutarate-dependent dioxygenase alkB homolog 7, mitochondrial [Protopterus annectens]
MKSVSLIIVGIRAAVGSRYFNSRGSVQIAGAAALSWQPHRFEGNCSRYGWMVCSNTAVWDQIANDVEVKENFISKEEEEELLKDVQPALNKLKYECDHWDDAIHGYRETEKSRWTEGSKIILQRVRDVAFPPGIPQLSLVHVLDLDKKGFIKPHVDSVKFCGSTISGLCLLSSSVMRLVSENNKADWADLLLQQRSLYILRGRARYEFTHAILKDEDSFFKGEKVPRDRRISVICRNLPVSEKQNLG